MQFGLGSSLASGSIQLGDSSGSANAAVSLVNPFGGQTVATSITVQAGSSGQGITVSSGSSTLDGVTLNSDLTLPDGANLTVQNLCRGENVIVDFWLDGAYQGTVYTTGSYTVTVGTHDLRAVGTGSGGYSAVTVDSARAYDYGGRGVRSAP